MFNLNFNQITRFAVKELIQVHHAVNVRRVGVGAADSAFFIHFVDQNRHAAAHSAGEFTGTDFLGFLHKAVVALLLYLFRDMVRQVVGFGAFHRAVFN